MLLLFDQDFIKWKFVREQSVNKEFLFVFQGTEVKAITYSNMQVLDDEEKHEVYVIIDI